MGEFHGGLTSNPELRFKPYNMEIYKTVKKRNTFHVAYTEVHQSTTSQRRQNAAMPLHECH